MLQQIIKSDSISTQFNPWIIIIARISSKWLGKPFHNLFTKYKMDLKPNVVEFPFGWTIIEETGTE